MMVVMVVMVAAATRVRREVIISRCDRLMVMVMVMRSAVLVERGVIDDGGRVRVPLVMRVPDDASRSGSGVHTLVAASAATADRMRLQPFGRYV